MKVAFIVPDNRDELKQFDVPNPFFGPAPAALLEGFAQLPGCEIHVISTRRRPMTCPQKVGPNIFFHSLHVPRWGRLMTLNIGTIRAIRAYLPRIKPDVVHGQGSERFPAIAAAYSGYPNIVTLHGIMTQIVEVEKAGRFSYPGVTAMVERRALKQTNSILCLSEHAAKVAERFNRRVTVIPNGIPDHYFNVTRRKSDVIEIICPAHIYHLKNQHGLIEALDPVAAKIPLQLTLMGSLTGDHGTKKVQEMAATRPWVRIAGMVDSRGMSDALARATLLVLPSFEENCPMSILEGMAVGVPIAASRAGGIPELVEHGVTGQLFDPRDPTSIRAAIELMLMNPELAQRYAAAGRRRAEAEFRTKTIAARHLEFYRAFLKR